MVSQSKIDEVKQNVRDIIDIAKKSALDSSRNPDDIKIMAVTKTVDPELVNVAIDCGIKLLGENRVQELLSKYDFYKKDNVEIHFIGSLQTNKVKYIIDKVSMIHSVNSLKLANEINKQAKKHNIIMDILIEVNIGGEDSKSGISPTEIYSLLEDISHLSNVKVKGLMAIPPICEKDEQIKHYFDNMYQLFIDIKAKKLDNIDMNVLSMGMSHDYNIAITSGSTLVRVGSKMFGSRIYNI
ncbi:MAG: YggS family pyridoxal phosphate-dependent enzyme [Oscillospiraceae bacterium]